jgi:hypothetical protein
VVGINTFVTRGTAFAGSVKYAQKVDSILPWLQQNNIQVATRTDACTPITPGLPAAPPQAGAPSAPGAPPALAPGATPAVVPGAPPAATPAAPPGAPPMTPAAPATPAR